MNAKFGPAGNSTAFSRQYKSSLNAPQYLAELGLDAYEYQCGRGVNIGTQRATELGTLAKQYGITLSLHAPYYISMSSTDEEKRIDGSLRYFLASAAAAKAMGATRIVFHTGSAGKIPRDEALALASDTLRHVLDAYDQSGYSELTLCPETMGKVNQLGTLEEVIALCRLDERLLPCLDFGHINARTQGGLRTVEDVFALFDQLENGIGLARTAVFHAHFSKIEYSKGGEVRHLTMADRQYGPDFALVAQAVAQRGYRPTFICESAEVQDTDALLMQTMYKKYVAERK